MVAVFVIPEGSDDSILMFFARVPTVGELVQTAAMAVPTEVVSVCHTPSFGPPGLDIILATITVRLPKRTNTDTHCNFEYRTDYERSEQHFVAA